VTDGLRAANALKITHPLKVQRGEAEMRLRRLGARRT
jgi:hypothetical protein